MSGRAQRVELLPIACDEGRFFIRLNGRHAGGITVHSRSGDTFSYGIAIARDMRGRGVASAALLLLFSRMRAQGFTRAVVSVRADNTPSLVLHRKLGFAAASRCGDVLTLQKEIGSHSAPNDGHGLL